VDATSHRVDLLCDLLGPPTAASGTVRSMEEGKAVEDVVSLTISMADGTLCNGR